jgi:hypothetical protein
MCVCVCVSYIMNTYIMYTNIYKCTLHCIDTKPLKWGLGYDSVAECSPSMHEALNSVSVTGRALQQRDRICLEQRSLIAMGA